MRARPVVDCSIGGHVGLSTEPPIQQTTTSREKCYQYKRRAMNSGREEKKREREAEQSDGTTCDLAICPVPLRPCTDLGPLYELTSSRTCKGAPPPLPRLERNDGPAKREGQVERREHAKRGRHVCRRRTRSTPLVPLHVDQQGGSSTARESHMRAPRSFAQPLLRPFVAEAMS